MVTFRMKDGTGKVDLKYTYEDTDRHGNVRIYVRRSGMKKVRLRQTPGTPEFLEEYRDALGGREQPDTDKKSVRPPAGKGTLRWLCEQYLQSAEYKRLDPRTQYVRRLIIDGVCVRDGGKPYALMEARHVRRRRDEKADKPEAANSLIDALRQVFAFAVDNDLAERNPAKDVPYLKSGSEGFHTWSIEEVRQFEDRHAVGTKARLALALLLYTGQRRSDVVTFGRQHLKNGWLNFTQVKNRRRKPITLSIPVRSEFEGDRRRNALRQHDVSRDRVRQALHREWIRQLVSPALRRSRFVTLFGARPAQLLPHVLAELGAGESEIMAITGHTTSKEVVRYTRGARQKVHAAKAIAL
jgi:integrase